MNKKSFRDVLKINIGYLAGCLGLCALEYFGALPILNWGGLRNGPLYLVGATTAAMFLWPRFFEKAIRHGVSQIVLIITGSLVFATFVSAYGLIYQWTGLIDSDGKEVHGMEECMYFSAITITTVGYGDFRPTPDSRIFAVAEAATGLIAFSITVGLAVNAAAEKKSQSVQDSILNNGQHE